MSTVSPTIETTSSPVDALFPLTRSQMWSLALAGPVVAAPVLAATVQTFDVTTFVTAGLTTSLMLLLVIGSYTDILTKRIPNWLTYSAVLFGVVGNAVLNAIGTTSEASVFIVTPIGLTGSLLGMLGCFAVMFLIYDLAGSGAGDVKLAAALGAIVGFYNGVNAILWCHLLAGACLMVYLSYRHGVIKIVGNFIRAAGSVFFPKLIRPVDKRTNEILAQPMPMAPFFAVGIILSLFGVTLV